MPRAPNRATCRRTRLSAWLQLKLCKDIKSYNLKERCSWTPVGLGARRPPARLCASSRRLGCRPHSWCSAKRATWNSVPPAKPAGTPDKAALSPCQSPSFLGRPAPLSDWRRTTRPSSAAPSARSTSSGMKAAHRWCAGTASTPSAGTALSLWTMISSWSTTIKDPAGTSWAIPGLLWSGIGHRSWAFLLDLGSCSWWPRLSCSWPLHLYFAASASAVKAMTTHYPPRGRHDAGTRPLPPGSVALPNPILPSPSH